jgi:hypothetical protein
MFYKSKKTTYNKELDSLKERMKTDRKLLKYEQLYHNNSLKGFRNIALIDKNFYQPNGNKNIIVDELLLDNEFEIGEALRIIATNLDDFNLRINRNSNIEKMVITDLTTNKVFYSKERRIKNGSDKSDLDINIISLYIKDRITRLIIKPKFGSSVLKNIRKI